MLPVIQVGPLALQVPGLILLVGLWLGLSLAERNTHRYGIQPESLNNLYLIVLLSGILGARLAYVLQYPAAFAASPLSVFSLNPGLLDPWGGFAVGLISGLIYAQRKNLPFWPLADALTPAFGIMAVAFGLANLASGDAFGAPSNLPWSIDLWGERRHPVQIYASLGALIILIAVLLDPGFLKRSPSGTTFLTFLALTAGLRLFLEAFRGNSQLLPGGLRSAQVIAWLVLAISLLALGKRFSITFSHNGRSHGSSHH